MPYNIKGINREYFQRSMFFLYPVLKIPSHVNIKPICTYLSWEDKYDVSDYRLICLFPKMDLTEPMKAANEKKYLLGNSRYETMEELEDGRVIYVFNLENLQKDWNYLLEGKYSKMSAYVKLAINDFFRTNSKTLAYMDSYINPSNYYETYAKMLDIGTEVLKEGVELLSKPDMSREHFSITRVKSELSV